MGWEALFCLLVIGLLLAGLVANLSADALLMGAVVLMLAVGIITPEEAFSGFSNSAMLTVGALYVVAAALRETGALDTMGAWVLGRARSERSALGRLAVAVTPMSAFLNNTPIVAMFIPIVTGWCKKSRVPVSRLLLPLSYLCILGGTCTLIGTSTNLVVNGLMIETAEADPGMGNTLAPMGVFELGRVGLPCAFVGVLYLILVGQRLLPARKDLMEQFTESSREYLVNLVVRPECRVVGKRIEEAGLRHLPGLFLVEIARAGEAVSPVPPDQILAAGDVLTFVGVIDTIVDLKKIPGLEASEGETGAAAERMRGGMLCEAVVSGSSPNVGKTIRDADFRATYNAVVVAVHRGGERLKGKVGDVVLRGGDTLLLKTGPHFARAHRNNPDFLLVSGVADSRPVRSDKAIASVALLFLLVTLMATGVASTVTAAFVVAGLMIAARCISVSEARQSVDWQTLVTIGAAFGLGKALVNSGCVEAVVGFVVPHVGPWGPQAVLVAIYILTAVITAIVTNNAAAALVFPFAVAAAINLGVSPRPFVMGVALAASASLVSPIGYQTNLMVYGPGGYRLRDFVVVGLPLNLVLLACTTVLVPLAWPF